MDRYAYVNNNPLKYTDPSGHSSTGCGAIPPGPARDACENSNKSIDQKLLDFGVTLNGEMENWTYERKYAVYLAVLFVGSAFAQERGKGESPAAAFLAVYEYVNITWETECYGCRDETTNQRCGSDFTSAGCEASGGVTLSAHSIMFASFASHWNLARNIVRQRNNVVHELGHAFDHILGLGGRSAVSADWDDLSRSSCAPNENCGFASRLNQRDWVMNPANENYEVFADQFLGWTFDRWENSQLGDTRRDWMNTNMAEWLDDY